MRGSTYKINPSPRQWVRATIGTLTQNDKYQQDNCQQRAPEQPGDWLADTLIRRNLEAPDEREELRVDNTAEDDSMRCECEIVELNRWDWRGRVTGRILFPDQWRIQKPKAINSVAKEPKGVDGGKIDC